MSVREHAITTLLFDWDGTLLDSAPRGFAAFEKTFCDLEVSFSREVYDACYSPNWYTMYETLNLPRELWQQADHLWIHHYGQEPAELVAGAHDTLLSLHRKRYALGIVTSGTRKRVTRELDELNLTSIFDAVVCNEDMREKKPHPEGLEKAMRLLGASTSCCSYVGDAPEDIQMGRNAGVLTIAVPSSYPTSKHLRDAHPDIHLGSINELVLHF